MVRSCLDGYSACIFAYGQTGSGKTFTMDGPEALPGGHFLGFLNAPQFFSRPEETFGMQVAMLLHYNGLSNAPGSIGTAAERMLCRRH